MNKEWCADRPAKNSSPSKCTKSHGFIKSENGSFTIFSLFLLLMMLMITGMAVDMMRAETQRSRLQSTLDRAVLAAASLEQSLDSEAVVRDYFETAGLTEHLVGVNVTPGANSKTVNAFARTNVTSSFMKLVGVQSLPALAGGQAEENFTNIEISLVVDISGSMGWDSSSGNPKIDDLIQAGKDFVYMVQCNPDDLTSGYTAPCTIEADTISVSLVPYMEQVNVGETLLNEFSITNEHNNSNCAEFATADYSVSNISLTDPLRRASHTDVYSWRGWYDTVRDDYIGCRSDSASEIVPLSNDWTSLQTRIEGLTPWGNTSIDIGMKWGTALLDPSFQPATANLSVGPAAPIIPAFSNRPVAYSDSSMQKVIVLMTDGVNTTEYRLLDDYRSGPSEFWFDEDTDTLSVYREASDRYYDTDEEEWEDDPAGTSPVQMSYPEVWAKYNVSYYMGFSWLELPVSWVQNNAKNANLLSTCAAAKAQGIDIYTLGFETTGASSAVMRNCATTVSHHFDVNGDSIADAFAAIARDIHQLRLTN